MSHAIRNVLVIHNPVAGRRRRRRLRQFLEILNEREHRVHIRLTTKAGDARDAAHSAQNIDVIIAAGGDGTVNEVVNGLATRPADDALPIVAFFPLGTANVLAWELDLPSRKPKRMVKLIEKKRTLDVHQGIANGHRFFLVASVGLDARAVAAVNGSIKRIFGGGAYVIAAVQALMQKPPTYKVVVGDEEYEARTVIVSCGRFYGGPFILAPQAHLGEPMFCVVMLKNYDFFSAIRFGLALVRGTLSNQPDVTIVMGDSVRIDGPGGDPVQLDGDITSILPLSITLDTRPVPFLVSKNPCRAIDQKHCQSNISTMNNKLDQA